MSMFHGASNIVINDGQFIAHSASKDLEREKDALRQLEQHVAFGAFHNSKERRDPPKCLPRTRLAVFREISDWIRTSSTDKPILWLYGPAGAGKSAIAQSIAEKVYRREIGGCLLVATFFFNRSNGERTNTERLIPSIAYQMTTSIPNTRQFVIKAIIQDPHVFSLNLRTQMEKLIIEPLLSAGVMPSADELPPMLIIVDGLDECQESDERTELIEALAENVQNPAFHLTILCHSRPESDIRTAFNNLQTSKLTARLVLDNRFRPDADIEILLDHDFSQIKLIHPLKTQLPRNWPPKEAIENLVQKSSGQFIYASTVMKYIASKKHNPTKRLEVVLNVGSSTDVSPFKELDALYTLVLSSVDESHYPTLVRIIGMICFPRKYGVILVTPELIDDVLSLEPGQTLLILNDLHSLIYVRDSEDIIDLDGPKDANSDDSEDMSSGNSENMDWFGVGLKPFHASFEDFLKDRCRADKYHVDSALVEADCALAYFKALLNSMMNSSPRYEQSAYPSDHFEGILTTELSEFFTSVPWQRLTQKALPIQMPSVSLKNWRHDSWIIEGFEFYRFCRMASGTSPVWAEIFKKACAGFSAWLADYFNLISSSADLATACIIQDELRLRYIVQMLKIERDFTQDHGALIMDILRTPGISVTERIDRQKHNHAIFETILEGLVTFRFVDHYGTLNDCTYSNQPCNECLDYFAGLVDLADRTPRMDILLAYFEGEDAPYSRLRSQVNVKRAIATYKEKSIPDDYDHGFRLEPSIDVLRERVEVISKASPRASFGIGLSDLGVRNFIRIGNFGTR